MRVPLCIVQSGALRFRSSRENISAAALVLHLGIWLALNDLFDLESRRSKIARHFLRLKEEEIDVHFLIPPVVEMQRFVTAMEGEQQQAVRLKNSSELAQGIRDFRPRNVNERIERNQPGPGFISVIQRGSCPPGER